MKIIRDNRIYIQAKDIALLADSHMDVPQEIVEDYNHTSSSRMNNLERYLCFEGETAIRFFSNQDWIINYDDIKNITLDDCLSLLYKSLDEKNKVLVGLSGLYEIKSKKTEAIINDRIKFLEYKNEQLKDIAKCIINEEPLPLPRELNPKQTVLQKISGFIKKIENKK